MKKLLLNLTLLCAGTTFAQSAATPPSPQPSPLVTTCAGGMNAMDDVSRVTQVVLQERQGRDRGWWAQMKDCYWPDSVVKLSWFTGPGPEFVTRSEAMVKAGSVSTHRLGPPIVHINKNRALVDVPAGIEAPANWQGVSAVLTSYSRIVYRLEKRGKDWRILTLDTIYERDSLVPSVPGQTVTVDPKSLEGRRRPYALLSLLLEQRGFPVGNDMLGDDQPAGVNAFYDDAFRWLNGG